MKINLNIPDRLLEKITAEAKAAHLNRTAYIITILNKRDRIDKKNK
jgi:hypothetical protein